MKLAGSDAETVLVEVKGRHLEGAFFQPAIHDGKGITFPEQQLHMRTCAVDKNEGITVYDILR